MRIAEARAMSLPPLAMWACACADSMEQMGVSDLGETGYMVACDAMGLALGVVFADDDGAISRVVAIDTE
jgi:hypothetical protein